MWLTTGATVFIFIWSSIHALSENDLATQLRQHLGSKSISLDNAVIIIIDPGNQLQLQERDEDSESYLTNSGSKEFRTAVDKADDDKPDDEEAYALYNVLRSQSQDGLDSSEIEKIDKLKRALRAAFQQKCKKFKNCVQKCSGTKKITCTVKCEEQYDEYNVCGGAGEGTTTTKDWCKVNDVDCGPSTTPTTTQDCKDDQCETDEPKTKKWGRKTWPPNWKTM